MEELDLERLVLPALLALLILGAFLILVTNGGGEESLRPPQPATATPVVRSTPARPATAPTGRFVSVQAGDTESSIATAAGMSVDDLADLNPSVDLNTLRPGQTLKLAR